jgi:hypothetical protein
MHFRVCISRQDYIDGQAKTATDKLRHLHDDIYALWEMMYLMYNMCQDNNHLLSSPLSMNIICDLCKQFTDPCFTACIDINHFVVAYMQFVSSQNPRASYNIPFSAPAVVRMELDPIQISFLSFVEGVTGNLVNMHALRWYLRVWCGNSSGYQTLPDGLCSRCMYACQTIPGKYEVRFVQMGAPCDMCMQRYLELEGTTLCNMSGAWEQSAESFQCSLDSVIDGLPQALSEVQREMVYQLSLNMNKQLRQFEDSIYTYGPFDAPCVVCIRSLMSEAERLLSLEDKLKGKRTGVFTLVPFKCLTYGRPWVGQNPHCFGIYVRTVQIV